MLTDNVSLARVYTKHTDNILYKLKSCILIPLRSKKGNRFRMCLRLSGPHLTSWLWPDLPLVVTSSIWLWCCGATLRSPAASP